MRIVVDVEGLQNEGLLTPSVAELLRIHAVRDGSSVAINLLLAFGPIAVAGGVLILMPKPAAGLVERLRAAGYTLLDTQYVNEHLKQFGVREIAREEYLELLGEALAVAPASF